MKKRRKARSVHLRFRKDDPAHNLLAAVQHWVKANGGSLVVIGGIEIMSWPHEQPSKFSVSVRCVGRRPDARKAGA